MKSFSERLKAHDVRQIQVEGMDDDLRNSLWNAVFARFDEHWEQAGEYLAKYLFKVPVDTVPTTLNGSRAWVRDKFFNAEWTGVYDIVEFLVINVDQIKRPRGISYNRYYSDQRD